jgi:hypothetical protein
VDFVSTENFSFHHIGYLKSNLKAFGWAVLRRRPFTAISNTITLCLF